MDLSKLRQETIDEFIINCESQHQRSGCTTTEFSADAGKITHPIYHSFITNKTVKTSIGYAISNICSNRLNVASVLSLDMHSSSRINHYGLNSISFDKEGALFATGGSNGKINIYDFDECYYSMQLKLESVVPPLITFDTRRDISCVSWSSTYADVIAVAFTFHSEVCLYDLSQIEGNDTSTRRVLNVAANNKGSSGHTIVIFWPSISRIINKNNKNMATDESVMAGSNSGYIRYWNKTGASFSPSSSQYMWSVLADPLRSPSTASAVVALVPLYSSCFSNLTQLSSKSPHSRSTTNSTQNSKQLLSAGSPVSSPLQVMPPLLMSATSQGVIVIWDLSELRPVSFGSTQAEPSPLKRIDFYNQIMSMAITATVSSSPSSNISNDSSTIHSIFLVGVSNLQSHHHHHQQDDNETIKQQALPSLDLLHKYQCRPPIHATNYLPNSVLFTLSNGSICIADLEKENIYQRNSASIQPDFSSKSTSLINMQNPSPWNSSASNSQLQQLRAYGVGGGGGSNKDRHNTTVLDYSQFQQAAASGLSTSSNSLNRAISSINGSAFNSNNNNIFNSTTAIRVCNAVLPVWPGTTVALIAVPGNTVHCSSACKNNINNNDALTNESLSSSLSSSLYDNTSSLCSMLHLIDLEKPVQPVTSSSSSSFLPYDSSLFASSSSSNGNNSSLSGKYVDAITKTVYSNMRKSTEFSCTLPGFVMTAEPGSYEVITSQDLQIYLTHQAAASASFSKSHEIQFDWSILAGAGAASVLGFTSNKHNRNSTSSSSSAASAGVVVYANGVPFEQRKSENIVTGMSRNGSERAICCGHRIQLHSPYIGPAVANGVPRVYIRTKLLPSGLPVSSLNSITRQQLNNNKNKYHNGWPIHRSFTVPSIAPKTNDILDSNRLRESTINSSSNDNNIDDDNTSAVRPNVSTNHDDITSDATTAAAAAAATTTATTSYLPRANITFMAAHPFYPGIVIAGAVGSSTTEDRVLIMHVEGEKGVSPIVVDRNKHRKYSSAITKASIAENDEDVVLEVENVANCGNSQPYQQSSVIGVCDNIFNNERSENPNEDEANEQKRLDDMICCCYSCSSSSNLEDSSEQSTSGHCSSIFCLKKRTEEIGGSVDVTSRNIDIASYSLSADSNNLHNLYVPDSFRNSDTTTTITNIVKHNREPSTLYKRMRMLEQQQLVLTTSKQSSSDLQPSTSSLTLSTRISDADASENITSKSLKSICRPELLLQHQQLFKRNYCNGNKEDNSSLRPNNINAQANLRITAQTLYSSDDTTKTLPSSSLARGNKSTDQHGNYDSISSSVASTTTTAVVVSTGRSNDTDMTMMKHNASAVFVGSKKHLKTPVTTTANNKKMKVDKIQPNIKQFFTAASFKSHSN